VIDKSTIRQLAGIGMMTAMVYVIFSYGGIRSPDSEVVFRTAEAFATKGTFAVTARLPRLESFGLPTGKDGRYYSLFGPGQPLASVPFVELGLLINKTEWYKSVPDFIPISHYVGDGLFSFVRKEIPPDLEPHALRFLVCFFNIFVGSLCVCFFFLLVKLLTQSDFAARCSAILFAFGSLMMPYSGTFFSEPLATLFVILSFYCLVWNELTNGIPTKQKYFSLLASGLFLGMAITVHLSAILFAPFFFVYGLYPFLKTRWSAREFTVSGVIFSAGVGFFLVLLGYYNYVRFGDVLETGRTVLSKVEYATYVAPWRGLFGLIFGSGKGIIWYCPAAVMSLFFWRSFHKRFPAISYTTLGSVLLRFFFIASRSDWHGGFSLGPRYMVMAIPLMMLPFGNAIADWSRNKDMRSLWLFFLVVFGCVIQQIFFSLGEVFSFFHMINWTFIDHGINVLQYDALYLDWDKSPLFNLLDAKRGPYLMKFLPMSNSALFWVCAGITALLLFLEYVRMLDKYLGRWR
jgi:hypothetical protein